MFTFGQGLYRLTERDLETLLVEPYIRSSIRQLAPAQASDSILFPVPQDRSLYLDCFALNWNFNFEALSVATAFAINLFTQAGTQISLLSIVRDNGGIVGDNAATRGAGAVFGINRAPRIILPPGVQVRMDVSRTGTANAMDYRFDLTGYLIPPGGVGRGI